MGLLTVILLSCSLLSANALNSNEPSFACSWSVQLYQGISDSVTVTYFSPQESFPEQITSLGIQFDWATTPITETVNSPVLTNASMYVCPSISFNIPSDAVVGSHNFTVSFQVLFFIAAVWVGESFNETGSVNVFDAYEKVYNQLAPTVQSSLTNAQNSNYQNPKAQSLLTQATSMYNQATALSQQGQWQNAVNDLNTASNDLSQAQTAEATTPSPTPSPTPTIPEFTLLEVLPLLLSVFSVAVIVRHRQVKKV
jgi:hypothetical protein